MSGRDYSADLFGAPAAGRDHSAALFGTPAAPSEPIHPAPALGLPWQNTAAPGPQALRPGPALGHPLAGLTDAQIAATTGMDYAAIRRSRFYRPGMLAAHVAGPDSPRAKTLRSVVGPLVQGMIRSGGAAAQTLAHVASPRDAPLADALTRLTDLDYGATHGGNSAWDAVGEMAGQALSTPLPLGEGTVARIGSGVIAGALQPVPDATHFARTKAEQIGAGVVLPEALHRVTRAVAPGMAARAASATAAAQFAATSRAAGVPLTAAEAGLVPRRAGVAADIVLERVPGGLQGFREQQQAGVQALVGRHLAETKGGMVGGQLVGPPLTPFQNASTLTHTVTPDTGLVRTLTQKAARGDPDAAALLAQMRAGTADWQQVAQADLHSRFGRVNATKTALYGTRDRLAAGLHDLPIPSLSQAVDDAQAELGDKLSTTVSDKRLAGTLRHIEERSAPETPVASGILDAQGMPLPAPPPGPATAPTFGSLTQLRSDLGDEIRTAQRQPNGGKLVRHLVALKRGVEADMETAATAAGDPRLMAAQRRADHFYRTAVVPFKAPVLKGLMQQAEGTTLDAPLRTFLANSGRGDAQFLFDRLGTAGKAAVQTGILANALEDAMRTKPGTMEPLLSPLQFLGSLERQQKTAGVFFRGADAQRWEGVKKILAAVPRAGQYLENPSTGARMADPVTQWLIGLTGGGIGAGGVALATGHPGVVGLELAGAAAGLGAAHGLRALMTTPKGQAFLLRMATLQPGSPALQTALERYVAQAGAHVVPTGHP